jgi:hypothetical protein
MPRLAPVGVDLPALFRQASYDGGIPVLYDPGKNKKLWLVMPYWREGSTWLQGEHSRHNHHYIRTGTSDPNHWEFPRLLAHRYSTPPASEIRAVLPRSSFLSHAGLRPGVLGRRRLHLRMLLCGGESRKRKA